MVKESTVTKVYIAFTRDGFVAGVFRKESDALRVSETVEEYEVKGMEPGEKHIKATQYLINKGVGSLVTVAEIQDQAGYISRGAANAFLKVMLLKGVLDQSGGVGTPYRVVALP